MVTRKRIAGITLAASATIAALLGGVVIYSGWYDVSATSPHTRAVYELLEVSMRRAVRQRASDVAVPALENSDRAINGFRQFRAHCVQCHGAPGIAPQPFALGLMPAPASLVATSHGWSAAEIYWIIRHGIKMSGMPAWRYRMNDEEIWDVVAFMKVLPTLSPTDYRHWDELYPDGPPRTRLQASSTPDARLGDAVAGRQALQQYLCVTCHTIPGIVGANQHVGPPLAGIAGRPYIAGVLPNTPANMLRWLRDPTEVTPMTAMPDLGVSEQDARDIAAFLYTLGE